MSLDKAIKHGKEHRKGYAQRGKPGRYDTHCRPHGSCTYCQRNRLVHETKQRAMLEIDRSAAAQRVPEE